MPQAGDRVGKYQLVSPIGTGGFAQVWLGRSTRDGSEAAVKILHADYLMDRPQRGPSAAERFVAEAKLLMSLRLPGLVEVFDITDRPQEGVVAYSMERLHGEHLEAAVASLQPHEILDAFVDVATTLAKLHARGVLHRDVKLTNIFVCESVNNSKRVIKLLDLGIAKDMLLRVTGNSTATGLVVGTLEIMSPESLHRLSGERVELTAALDQWGLGVSVYKCLAGHAPFSAVGPASLLAQILEQPVPALRPMPRFGFETLPASAEGVIQRCLQKEPEARYASMSELTAALCQARDELEALTPSTPGPPPRAFADALGLPAYKPGLDRSATVRERRPDVEPTIQDDDDTTPAEAHGASQPPVHGPDDLPPDATPATGIDLDIAHALREADAELNPSAPTPTVVLGGKPASNPDGLTIRVSASDEPRVGGSLAAEDPLEQRAYRVRPAISTNEPGTRKPNEVMVLPIPESEVDADHALETEPPTAPEPVFTPTPDTHIRGREPASDSPAAPDPAVTPSAPPAKGLLLALVGFICFLLGAGIAWLAMSL